MVKRRLDNSRNRRLARKENNLKIEVLDMLEKVGTLGAIQKRMGQYSKPLQKYVVGAGK